MFLNFNFFQRLYFQPHCYLKLTLFKLQNYREFSRIFLRGELYRFGGINELDLTNFQIHAQHKKLPKEHVTYSFWWTLQLSVFISDEGSCQFLYKYQLLLPWSGKVGHHTSIFTETKNHFMQFFAAVKAFIV